MNLYPVGLFFNDKLVSAISFRRPFVKKYGNCIELARYVVKQGHQITGGFQKLLAFVKPSLIDFDKILTYSDLRFGRGEIYLRAGFEFVGQTLPDYFYIDFELRYNRFHYRAGGGLTEKEVAAKHEVHRIHGTGSNIYTVQLDRSVK